MRNNKMYLSHTGIKTFCQCKQRFKYKYITKMCDGSSKPNKYISFGNSIHMTMADFNIIPSIDLKTLDNLHNLLRKNWIREGYETIDEERKFGLRGLDMLSNYYHEPKDIGTENLIIEEMLKMDLDNNFILCGKLDKVYITNTGGIEVLDYKTGENVSPIDQLQLTIYIILANDKLGDYPSTASFYYLGSNKKVVQEVTRNLIEESNRLIYVLGEHISKEKDFSSNPTIYCKNNCPYFQVCNDAKDINLIALNNLKNSVNISKTMSIF